eukprot:g11335.t1
MSSTSTVPPHQQQQQQQTSAQQCAQPACTPRLTFWIAAGSSWLVWMFAVAAGADDKWLRDDDGSEFLAAGQDRRLDFCNDNADDSVFQDYCAVFKAFTAMQVIATIACSFSVLLLSIAFFRPAGGGCFSTRQLAFIGGGLMATHALFQLIAVVLCGTVKDELYDAVNESSGGGFDGELGPTFGVAVTAVILATAFSVLLLLFARYTGNGPLYECCHSLLLANKANDNASGSAIGESVAGSKPTPMVATAATAPPDDGGAPPTATGTVASAAPPPPSYSELPPAADV